jgi:hypothetical protein
MQKKLCPHCGEGVGEAWHESNGMTKLDKGWIEARIPVVGRVKFQREAIVVVYFCLKTGLPFLMTLPSAK